MEDLNDPIEVARFYLDAGDYTGAYQVLNHPACRGYLDDLTKLILYRIGRCLEPYPFP